MKIPLPTMPFPYPVGEGLFAWPAHSFLPALVRTWKFRLFESWRHLGPGEHVGFTASIANLFLYLNPRCEGRRRHMLVEMVFWFIIFCLFDDIFSLICMHGGRKWLIFKSFFTNWFPNKFACMITLFWWSTCDIFSTQNWPAIFAI